MSLLSNIFKNKSFKWISMIIQQFIWHVRHKTLTFWTYGLRILIKTKSNQKTLNQNIKIKENKHLYIF